MEDNNLSAQPTLMTIKKLDDPTSKDFWEYVEKSKQEWQEQQPSWSRELDERRASASTEDADEEADALVV